MTLDVKNKIISNKISWEPVAEAFWNWLGQNEKILEPGLAPAPTIKVLIFLALYYSERACTYQDLKDIFHQKQVVNGNIPDNTLRTSILSLGKTLDKFNHALELKSIRGCFQLIPRISHIEEHQDLGPVLLLHPPAIIAEDVAFNLIEKAVLSFSSLYFLEWSARWWSTYSSQETETRVKYEADAWEYLGIKNYLSSNANQLIGIVSLAPGEGLAEIELLKKILRNDQKKIHYLAIDSSPKLLRDHIGLVTEAFASEIESGQMIYAGVVADIFTGLQKAIERVRDTIKKRKTFKSDFEFLPSSCNMLITYFGNCLGNNHYDQETEFFFMLQSIFQNRPLAILVGVSVMRTMPDEYVRNWDDFLLQTARHLLETKKLLESSRDLNSIELEEFLLPKENKTDRCPVVQPEQYTARHQIEGKIYRFYYKLAYDLYLSKSINPRSRYLPKGTLIQLYTIIKYNMPTLISGIEKSGLFKINYDPSYHQILDTPNGLKEYAVFCALI